MQNRRLTAAAVAGLAMIGLVGCRTAPSVAAYVGDSQVTVAELESAVDDRLADPAVEQVAGGDREAYSRQVLTQLVEDEVHTQAAARYGVEVTADDVEERLDVLLAGQDRDAVFAQLAEQQGLTPDDIFATVRQQLIRLAIAEEEDLAGPLSEDALRERYEESTANPTQVDFGYITVPDEATADQVVASLGADPDRYAELAGRFAGDFTLAELQPTPVDQIPGPLAEGAADADPGTAFAVPVEEAGGIVVGFVGPTPSFDELRPQLEQEASGEVDQEVASLVDEIRQDLDVVVNPRYGDLEDGQVQPAEAGFVDILEG